MLLLCMKCFAEINSSTVNRLWIRKASNFVTKSKLIINKNYSRIAQPAAIQSEKLAEDEDIQTRSSSQTEESNPSTTKEELISRRSNNPILFVRSRQRYFDLAGQPSSDSFGKDVNRLLELLKAKTKDQIKTQDNRIPRVVPSEKGEQLKLVNAISPLELQWKEQKIELDKLPGHYLKLSKIRLTGLVVLTTLGGYIMAPGALHLGTLAVTCFGTGLTSAAANTLNQFFEVPFDSQMNRTKNRVLVKGIMSPLHAVTFAAVCATSGITMLALGANGLTAALGASNLILYSCIYTPMKRLNIANTWVGSIVGAIPPVMGWVACTGAIDIGCLLLGAILFAWQFPHFNALSWNLRSDYSRGGYRMMSVTAPDLCRRTAFRYSLVLLGLCTALPAADVTTWTFAIDSLPVNLYFIYLSWQFYKNADTKSSRKLFKASLLYLPVIMMLLAISKKTGAPKKPDKTAAVLD